MKGFSLRGMKLYFKCQFFPQKDVFFIIYYFFILQNRELLNASGSQNLPVHFDDEVSVRKMGRGWGVEGARQVK